MHRTQSRHCRAAGLAASAALVLCTWAAGWPAQAAEPGLAISHPWMRAVMTARPAAGYFTLSNHAARAATLVGASSPGCGMLMLHRSVHENGKEKMVMVKSIAVPAHGAVEFAPGGYHLMCMSPSAAVTPGRQVTVTLRFGDGGSLTASFPVRGATGK